MRTESRGGGGNSSTDTCDRGLQSIRQLAEMAQDFIFIISPDSVIQYINPSASNLFQLHHHQIIGRSLSDICAMNGNGLFHQKVRELFESGQYLSCEEKFNLKDRKVWLDIRATPVRDETGAVVAAFCIARDTTGRKHREDLVERAKQEWERAVDMAPYPLAVVDNRFRVMRVNSAMAQRIDIPVREAKGLICYERLHEDGKPPAYCPLRQGRESGEGRAAEFCENHWGGSYHVHTMSLTDQDGKVTGCVYIGREITERDRSGNDLQTYMQSLMKRSDSLVLIQDRGGRYLFASATPDSGAGVWRIIGKTPFDLFMPSDAANIMDRLMGVAQTGKELVQLNEFDWGGEKVLFQDQISPVPNGSQGATAVVTISRKVKGPDSIGKQASTPADGPELSRREREILKLIAAGSTNGEIAEKLCISKKTVETHRSRIMQKLDIHKTSALVVYALRTGLL